MNIVVLTSAMVSSEFSSYQNSAKIKPNPSNQNFYSKLIQALTLRNRVFVVSHRPLIKGMFKPGVLAEERSSEGSANFFYTRVDCTKRYKLFNEQIEIMKTANEAIEELHTSDFIIIVDTLRVGLLKAAMKLRSQHGCKVIGMLTDNPDNLSVKSMRYSKKIKSIVSRLDGYLSLSTGLVDIFNHNKPHYVFEGLVSDEKYFKKDPVYDYYFFGGALYERYGVKALVDAFHRSSLRSKLIIAGSGPLAKYIEQLSYEDYRILYLTQLPKERVLGYEMNAIANINPRPLDKHLDSQSVPSKLIEYLSTGVPTISTKFEKLYGPFKDDVNWIEGNDTFAIQKALEDFEMSNKEEAKKKAYVARQKAFEFYGLSVQSESITYFLTDLSSSNND